MTLCDEGILYYGWKPLWFWLHMHKHSNDWTVVYWPHMTLESELFGEALATEKQLL